MRNQNPSDAENVKNPVLVPLKKIGKYIFTHQLKDEEKWRKREKPLQSVI